MSDDKNLYYLDELPGYKVADDYSDIRGWEVKDADHRTIGKVDDLMVNKKAERVVYLDVEVDQDIIKHGHETYAAPANAGVHEFLKKDGDNHLIIPIGMVTLDEVNKTVQTEKIKYNTFSKAARFSKGTNIERNYEISVMHNYIRTNIVDKPSNVSDSFYDGNEFEGPFRP